MVTGHGYAICMNLTGRIQFLPTFKKPGYRYHETVRKKGSDGNSHMEMQRRRYMKGRLGKKGDGEQKI